MFDKLIVSVSVTNVLEWIAQSNHSHVGFVSHSKNYSMGLAKIRMCKLVGMRLNRYGLVLILSEYWVQNCTLWGEFSQFISSIFKPAWCWNFSKLFVIVTTCRSTLSVCMRWAFTAKTLPKTSKVSLIALDDISNICSSCFSVTLTMLAG